MNEPQKPSLDPHLPANPREKNAHARSRWMRGYEAQMKGEVARAVELYQQSLDIKPTAEAHTFLGWAHSFRGELSEAIEECRKAIRVDPSFGNPYNDLGAYLLQMGRCEEAIPWLQKALKARRYEPRHYAHYNLGFAYLHLGCPHEALRQFKRALKRCPGYEPALRMIHYLKARMT